MTYQPLSLVTRTQEMIHDHVRRSSTLHSQFLDNQQKGLDHLGELLEMQISSVQIGGAVQTTRPQALFDTDKLVEFATGSMMKCFGPEFGVFEGRRHPRIPNGDLMLMSRILEIDGKRHEFTQPASIIAEFDVPEQGWFYRNPVNPGLPYSVWMEIALQPCGFLAAYLGTPLLFPQIDYYFRNLDGQGEILSDLDLRGQTVQVKARLNSTVTDDCTVIQKFTFECSCGNVAVFKGWSIFGFFPPESMANQVGLDNGKGVLPVYEQPAAAGMMGSWIDLANPEQSSGLFVPEAGKPDYHMAQGQMRFLDRVFLSTLGQSRKGAYLYALKENDPGLWFYSNHFYQDPVMPGSLGIEAILEAMQLYALRSDLGNQFRSPRFALPMNRPMLWKYRGQILPSHRQMKLEVNVTSVERSSEQVVVEGDASLWADAVRIYEVKHAAICLVEGAN